MFVDQSSGRPSSFLAVVLKGMWFATALSLYLAAAIPMTAAEPKPPIESERLVAAAVQAEVAGDIGQYLTLLQAAVRSDPNNKVARWQLGQVQVGKDWVSAEEAQRRSAKDPLQADYRQRRAAASDSLADQIRLARWCRDNKLNDEAELHWTVVLSHDPMNKEAQRAVDMLWKGGRLVSRKEPSEQKQRAQAAKSAAKYWEPMIAKWRRAVAGHDVRAHDQALTEIRAISRLDAIPSLEAVTLGRDAHDTHHAEECLQVAVAFLEALAQMPQQAATQSIVRHAVLSPGNKARNAATAELKKRDQHDYVPLLLAELAMPIESSYRVTETPDGSIYYMHSLYQEGQEIDRAVSLDYATQQFYFPGKRYVYQRDSGQVFLDSDPPTIRAAKIAHTAAVNRNRYVANIAEVEEKVAQSNQYSESLSRRIIPVLASTSGKNFATARQWWDWWRDKNEYYTSEHPVDQQYYSDTDRRYYGQPTDTIVTVERHSCFAKGTPVWTKTGQVPIETIEPGDLVLSQDVNSGDLSYKPVLAKTVRPPSRLLAISLEVDEMTATPGHPFWVAGAGWRMAKELGNDARLHGINGSSRVQSVASSIVGEAHNLIVADYNTYFVGKSGILSHDVMPRQPTQTIVPGVIGAAKK